METLLPANGFLLVEADGKSLLSALKLKYGLLVSGAVGLLLRGF